VELASAILDKESWRYTRPDELMKASKWSAFASDYVSPEVWPSELTSLFSEDEQRICFLNGNLVPNWSQLNIPGCKTGESTEILIPPGQNLKLSIYYFYDEQPIEFQSKYQTQIRVSGEAHLDIFECHYALADSAVFLRGQSNIEIAGGGSCHLTRVFSLKPKQKVYDQTNIDVFGSAKIVQMNFGGGLVRCDLRGRLRAEGAELGSYGLTLGQSADHIDHNTEIEHAEPKTISTQLYKGIYSERSRGIFAGKILIQQDAQESVASQLSKNILIGDLAEVNTLPRLEVNADDVKAAHGATIGQLSDDELFYLRSRAIDRESAEKILAQAFCNDILNQVSWSEAKNKIERLMQPHMPKDLGLNGV
jgi:Fe-S cluster assembly protein SufD